MINKWDDRELAALLEAAQPPLKPLLTDKALAVMTEAVRTRSASPALSRRFGTISGGKRRLLAAASLAVLLAGLMFWLLPRRGLDSALANMARALAQVQSAHFSGVSLDYDTGDYLPIEGWVKGPIKLRLLTEGREDEIHNGQTKTVINLKSTPTIVRLSSENELDPAMEIGPSYLNLFRGDIVQERARGHNAQITSKEVTLPDGRAAFVVESTKGEWRDVYTIAADTDLLVSWERYLKEKLTDKIARVEYNINIPDSIFAAQIPKDAIVDDYRAPLSETATQPKGTTPRPAGKISHEPSDEPILICVLDQGTCWSDFHPRLAFMIIAARTTITYLPKENVYRVQGAARIRGMGIDTIVRNADFTAPAPDITVEQWREREAKRQREMARRRPSPEVQAKREIKSKQLIAEGAKCLTSTWGAYSNGGYMFEVLDKMIQVWYSPSRKAFYVMGKAYVSGHGLAQIVEDGWIKASGPPPKLPE